MGPGDPGWDIFFGDGGCVWSWRNPGVQAVEGTGQSTVIANSSDGPIDFYGRPISERTWSILDKFENAKVVEVIDARGNSSKILVIENLKKGEVKVGDLGNLQAVTGNEFSLFRGPDGQRVLIQGDSTQISIPYKYTGEGWKWSGHSHPANPRPSSNDKAVLELFDQDVSMIKSITGAEEVFDSSKDMSNWLPGWEG